MLTPPDRARPEAGMNKPPAATRHEHLTDIERDHYERAELYLNATEYLAALGAPGFGDAPHLLYEGRYAARGVLALAATVNMLRAGRIA